jgi:uncharacterized repeat protein (TIGR01451 family)
MKRIYSAFSYRNSIILVSSILILFFLIVSGLPSSNPVISTAAVEASAEPIATANPGSSGSLRRSLAATPFFVPNITATKVDSIFTDNDSDGKADPGDVLMYTVTIGNTGADPATGVTFTDTIDPNTTLVPGSVLVSPIAVNDTYNTIGNVNIQVPAPGVIANDLNPNVVPSTTIGALVVTQVNATAVPGGGSATAATANGSVTLSSDGSFTYTPNAAFRGPTDTFTYTLGNTTGKTDTATVTISVSGMIWFVNNDDVAPGTPPGDGRLTNPFRQLAGANSFDTLATDIAGDNIFIYTGDSGTTPYTGGLTLLNTQKIIGQGAPTSILAITGFTAPSGNNLLPATNGTDPVITTAGTIAITLGQNNELHGFTVGNTGAAGTDISGTTFGTSPGLTVKDVTLNGSGKALNLMTGTIVTGSTFATLESTGGSPSEGVDLDGVGGGFTVTTTNIVAPTGTGISVINSAAMANFSFGTTTVNKSNAGTGINLATNASNSTISFGALTLTTTSAGSGLVASNSGTVNVTSGTITSTGGAALDVSSTAVGMSFSTVSSTNSTATGITLSSVTGTLSITTTTVTNSTNAGISVASSSVPANFGSATVNGSGGTGVSLSGNSGNLTFATLNVAPDTGARGLHATTNTGTIIINSDGDSSGGTITTNSGTAVEIVGTSTASRTLSNITLSGINATGGANGIVLQNIDTNPGGFTVTGTSGGICGGTTTVNASYAPGTAGSSPYSFNSANNGDCTGGLIQNTTSDAIRLTDVIDTAAPFDRGVSFTRMRITNIGSGTGDNAKGIEAVNLGGTNLFRNGQITVMGQGGGADRNGIDIRNTNTNMALFSVENCYFNNNDSGTSFLFSSARGTSTMRFDVKDSMFEELVALAVQSNAGDTEDTAHTVTTNITGNVFRNASTADGQGGIAVVNAEQQATHNFTVSNNVFENLIKGIAGGNSEILLAQTTGGALNGTISGNILGTAANGNGDRRGIGVITEPDVAVNGELGSFDIIIENNKIDRLVGREGIFVDVREDTQNSELIIRNNLIGTLNGFVGQVGGSNTLGTDREAVDVQVRGDTAKTVNMLMTANVIRSTTTFPTGSVNLESNNDVGAEATAITFQATVTNNQIVNTGGVPELTARIRSGDTGATLCLDMTGNTFDSGAGTVSVEESGGTFNVEQASQAALAAANGIPTGNVLLTGSPSFGVTCSVPPSGLAPPPEEIESAAMREERLRTESSSTPGTSATGLQDCSQSMLLLITAVLDKQVKTESLSTGDSRLSETELAEIVQQAIARWKMFGISYEEAERLKTIKVRLADLQGAYLSKGAGNEILIDRDAAGLGWFVDQSPLEDWEFDQFISSSRLRANWNKNANSHMDLLTVVMQQLGESIRKCRPEPLNVRADFMNPVLLPGLRRLPVDSSIPVSEPETSGATPLNQGVATDAAAPINTAAPASQGSDVVSSGQTAAQSSDNITLSPQSGETVSLTLGTLPPGESITIMFRATINSLGSLPAGTVQVCNQGTVSGSNFSNVLTDDPDVAGVNQATCTQLDVADLAVTKTDSPDPVIAGQNITYTITVTNNGPQAAASASLTDAIPANTTFVSVNTPAGWTRTDSVAVGGTGNITFTNPSVANAASAVFTLVVKVTDTTADGTVISNTATVAATTSDTTPANNTATATTNVTRRADLAVTKSDSPDPVQAGSNITYTIGFTNNGPNTADNTTVTDAVPANTTFVSASVTTGTGWTPTTPSVGGTGNVVFSKASVANGETATFSIVVKVNDTTANGATITNSVTAASNTVDGTPANNTATAMTTVTRQADLAITKSDAPDPAFAGNNITYTLNFTNNGPNIADSVTVTDAVPTNTTFVSATVTTGTGWTPTTPAVGGTGNVVFSKASVANGETATFTIVVMINAATPNGTTITNTATVASTTTDPVPGNNSATATTTANQQADLSITKTDSPDPVFAGNNITYTVTLTNSGPGTASTVTVTDAVPTNTTFVSASVTTGTGWTPSTPSVGGTGNVVFSKAAVANGETAVFSIVVKVTSSVANGTTISNTATAASTTADPTPGDNSATATTTVATQADVSITKTDSPDPVVAGNNITYTITVTNNGPSDASTVNWSDTLPAGTTFVSLSAVGGWTPSTPAVGSGGVVSASTTTLAPGSAVFTLVVKVTANVANGTTLSNTATVSTTTTDPTPGNNSATATTTVQTQADLSITKTDSPDPVVAGQNITYTINFTNNGPSDAQTVTITDAIPANTTFVSASGPGGWTPSLPAIGGTGNAVFSKATVAAGETASFTIVVKVNTGTANGTTISNTATTASATTDPSPGNNSATATTTVQAQADLAVTKTDSPDPVVAGQNITYTVNFTNNGPSDAQTVTVTDAVPANTTFVSATVTTGTGWTPSTPSVGGTGNVVFSKSSVTASETATFTIIVKVNSGTAAATVITNTATTASATTDPSPANNSATATTTVQVQADLAITKTDSPDPVVAGQNITYTVNFVNNGPSDAQTVTLTDAVPANTTFVSATVTTGTGWTPSTPSVGGTGNVVFSKATVAPGETAVFTIVVQVVASTANGATITNTATAATTSVDPTPGNNSATATTAVITQADLSVTKTDSPDPVIAGQNITYTINFTNNGSSDAQTVTVTDAVPANTTFVSISAPGGWSGTTPAVGGTGNVVFSKATVSAGETASFTIVVKVNTNAANASTISNTVTAASATTDPTPANNSSTAATTVNTRADLAVTKSDSPDPVSAGGNLTYTITYTNNGSSDAQTVTVTDAVPANTTFVSATVTTGTGWSTSAPAVGGTGNVVFSKAASVASETATFTIVVKVNSNVASGSTITNSVTAASATTDPTPGNNTATAVTTTNTMADISVTKTDSPDPVIATQNLTYTVTLTNNGPSDAQTVTMTDPVPANTTFVSATGPKGWTPTLPAVGGTGNVIFSKATVTAGEVAVFTIVVNVNAGTPHNTTITNSATGATTTTDPNPGNNVGTATTTVLAQADLAVTKSDSPDPVCVGGNITYTINFIDNGPGPGVNTTVTDAVPANTTFVSATVTTGTGWSTSAPAVGGTGNVVFSKASVANGETAVFTIVVKVNNGTVHHTLINNTVTAASSIPDPTPGNNSATAQTTVDPIAPTITCPANIVGSITGTGTCAVVNYPAPTVSDNCSATVVCTPPSGTCFPVGTTTVSCTATDTAGNTATCSFSVTVFDICIQDDSNPGTVLLLNSATGEYRFCCNGTTYTGTGTVKIRGSVTTLEHFTSTRRVTARVDKSTAPPSGMASIQQPIGSTLCQIIDRDIRDNSCNCQ